MASFSLWQVVPFLHLPFLHLIILVMGIRVGGFSFHYSRQDTHLSWGSRLELYKEDKIRVVIGCKIR